VKKFKSTPTILALTTLAVTTPRRSKHEEFVILEYPDLPNEKMKAR
jgi:hypothetical protein